jgi:hypothetical protein
MQNWFGGTGFVACEDFCTAWKGCATEQNLQKRRGFGLFRQFFYGIQFKGGRTAKHNAQWQNLAATTLD